MSYSDLLVPVGFLFDSFYIRVRDNCLPRYHPDRNIFKHTAVVKFSNSNMKRFHVVPRPGADWPENLSRSGVGITRYLAELGHNAKGMRSKNTVMVEGNDGQGGPLVSEYTLSL